MHKNSRTFYINGYHMSFDTHALLSFSSSPMIAISKVSRLADSHATMIVLLFVLPASRVDM